MLVRGVEDVAFDELGEIELADGETRRCRALRRRLMSAQNAFESFYRYQSFQQQGTFPGTEHGAWCIHDGALGRVYSGLGTSSIDDARRSFRRKEEISTIPMNPAARSYPEEFIQTGVSAIDGLNTLVRGQKLPIFSASGLPYAQLAAQIARQAKVRGKDEQFAVVFGKHGYHFRGVKLFVESFKETAELIGIVMFALELLANDPVVERTYSANGT